jgi:hypothetical protein
MNQHLFQQVNINLANTHLPDGRAADLGGGMSPLRKAHRTVRGHKSPTARHRQIGPHRVQRTAFRVEIPHPRKSAHAHDHQTKRAVLWRRSQDAASGVDHGRRHDSRCAPLYFARDRRGQSGNHRASRRRPDYEHGHRQRPATARPRHGDCGRSRRRQVEGTRILQWIFNNEPEWEEYR